MTLALRGRARYTRSTLGGSESTHTTDASTPTGSTTVAPTVTSFGEAMWRCPRIVDAPAEPATVIIRRTPNALHALMCARPGGCPRSPGAGVEFHAAIGIWRQRLE